MMSDFIVYDSYKEGIMFDIAAFREWRCSKNNEDEVDTEEWERLYEGLHNEAMVLYGELVGVAVNLSDIIRIRLFRFLQGETLQEIGQSENPPVTRQAIHKSLAKALNGIGAEMAKYIWQYGNAFIKLTN